MGLNTVWMEANDEQLIKEIRNGRQPALMQYAENNRARLLSLIRNHMSPRLAAKVEPQDILQDTLVHAVKAFSRTDLSQVSPYTWLCRLAEQRIIEAHRHFFGTQKRAAFREVSLNQPRSVDQSVPFVDLLVGTMTSPSEYILHNQKARVLMAEFEQLSSDIRAAIRSRYVDGLSSTEIADRIGKSEGAVRVLLSRGVKKLRASLDPP